MKDFKLDKLSDKCEKKHQLQEEEINYETWTDTYPKNSNQCLCFTRRLCDDSTRKDDWTGIWL